MAVDCTLAAKTWLLGEWASEHVNIQKRGAAVAAVTAEQQLLAQFAAIQAEAEPVHSPREAQEVHVACESVPEHAVVAAGRGAAVTKVWAELEVVTDSQW